jgi:hypothetical protein
MRAQSIHSPRRNRVKRRLATEEFVSVPVPRELVPAVYALVARGRDPGTDEDGHRVPWTTADLIWLRQLLAEQPIALDLLEVTASLDGEPVTFRDFCKATYSSPAEARGELARLTATVRKYFHRVNSPLEAHWEDGGTSYRMRPDIAVLWRELP